jgi:hypothetical protein
MTERKFLYRVCKDTEKKFNVICYAYKTTFGDKYIWNLCIDDYELYMHDAEFKQWRDEVQRQAKAENIRTVFCYCYPNEENLWKLLQIDNLVIVH